MTRTSNFTDAQKAYFYERDRATCVYTGRNLWILDGGAKPDFEVDWADHVEPVSGEKPGKSDEDNGVCASSRSNFKKRDNRDSLHFLVKNGEPQCRDLPQELLDRLKRLSKIESSDWYFNRAMFRLLCGVRYLHTNNPSYKRKVDYYAEATRKATKMWNVAKGSALSFEDRGLVPVEMMSSQIRGQMLMLSLRNLTGDKEAATIEVAAIIKAMEKLLPIYRE